jgi:hypothetical protein
MATIKTLYGTEKQAITITLGGLASAAYRQSAVIDNTTNLFTDVLVTLQAKTNAAGTSATGYVSVFAYGTVDIADAIYTDGASGLDAAMTPTSPTNLKMLGNINAVANATTYTGGPWDVAAAFGGVVPEKWGIVVQNNTGAALDATEGSHTKYYQGIQGQSV